MANTRRPARSLQEELQQSRPFPNVAVELLVNLYRTADAAGAPQRECLRAFELTHAQFNVLRILAGAGTRGHRVADIAERLVTRDPDVTRLVDGLVRKALAERTRAEDDRRVVRVTITPAGRTLVRRASAAVEALAERQFAHLSASEQRTLVHLLTLLRSGPGPDGG